MSAVTTALSPITYAGERSMPPEIITKVSPVAIKEIITADTNIFCMPGRLIIAGSMDAKTIIPRIRNITGHIF
jgi:hypothetical protein